MHAYTFILLFRLTHQNVYVSMCQLQIKKAGIGRKIIWSDSLIHAREWLSGATILKILNNVRTYIHIKISQDLMKSMIIKHISHNYIFIGDLCISLCYLLYPLFTGGGGGVV